MSEPNQPLPLAGRSRRRKRRPTSPPNSSTQRDQQFTHDPSAQEPAQDEDIEDVAETGDIVVANKQGLWRGLWRCIRGLIGGFLGSLVGAFLWYLVARWTDRVFGLLAIGIGWTAGWGVVLFAGRSRMLQLLGAITAVFGCVLAVTMLEEWYLFPSGLVYNYNALDLLFLALAVGAGWIVPRKEDDSVEAEEITEPDSGDGPSMASSQVTPLSGNHILSSTGSKASLIVDNPQTKILILRLEDSHRIEVDNSKFFGTIKVDGQTIAKKIDLSGMHNFLIMDRGKSIPAMIHLATRGNDLESVVVIAGDNEVVFEG